MDERDAEIIRMRRELKRNEDSMRKLQHDLEIVRGMYEELREKHAGLCNDIVKLIRTAKGE